MQMGLAWLGWVSVPVALIVETLKAIRYIYDVFSCNNQLRLRELLDAVREFTTPPDPPKRPIGFVTHEDKKDPPKKLTAGRSKKV